MSKKQKRTKIHHIVPKVLQRNFTVSGNKIWFAERDKLGQYGKPQERSINSTFQKRNFYTVLEDEEPSDIVEREYYGHIDNFMGTFIPECLEIFAKGKTPTVSLGQLQALRDLMLETAKRSPDFIASRPSDYELGQMFYNQILNRLNVEQREENEKYQALLQNKTKVEQVGRDIRVRSTLTLSPRSAKALQEFTLRWAISTEKHSFILSRRMVYQIGNGGPNGLMFPNAELWMPISPNISAVLLRDPTSKIPKQVSCSRDKIRKINRYAATSSSQVASHSPNLLDSIIRSLPKK